MSGPGAIIRIGVFYDGNYFSHVSNYYQYVHWKRSRINIRGLHEFIRAKIAEKEGADLRYCHIVEAHYFRGRQRAADADQRGMLLKERQFEDVLIREGIVTHYLPVGPHGEKGIDVWLALEAFERAVFKRFDAVALVVCDGDFLPLVRKLCSLGTRVMLLAWDFRWVDQNEVERETKTAQVLLEEATYPFKMSELIDDEASAADPLISGLFMSAREARAASPEAAEAPSRPEPPAAAAVVESVPPYSGTIHSIKAGYGFISPADGGGTIFFHYSAVTGADFNDLKPGDIVIYRLGSNDKGPCAVDVELVKPAE